jgi:hypothetical protein
MMPRGQLAGTAWTTGAGTVDSRLANVDETAPSVDERVGTLGTPRNYILWYGPKSDR